MAFLQYTLDHILGFLLRCIFRYRLTIVQRNLKDSFLYEHDGRLKRDIYGFYLYLAKIIRQIIVRPTKSLLEKRIRWTPSLLLDEKVMEGKSVIVTLGHIGNWEWTGSFLGVKYPDRVCALFKRIKSGPVNALMQRRRSSHGKFLIDNKKIGELIRLMRQKPLLILMIADQNPASEKNMVWVPFLGRKTAFLNGPENLARRYSLPIVYIRSEPVGWNDYSLRCQWLYDGEEITEPGELTRRYAAALEENILAHRSHWLWSHKRWKRIYPDTPESAIQSG